MCGQGVQHRNVICRDSRGKPSAACNTTWKPVASQPCTGVKKGCKSSLDDAEKDKKASTKEKEANKEKQDSSNEGNPYRNLSKPITFKCKSHNHILYKLRNSYFHFI